MGTKSPVLRLNMLYSFYGKHFLNDHSSTIFNFSLVMSHEFVAAVFNLNVIKPEPN